MFWGVESLWFIFRLRYYKNVLNFLRRERGYDVDYVKGFIIILYIFKIFSVIVNGEDDGSKWKFRIKEEVLVVISFVFVFSEVSFELRFNLE